MQLRQKEGGFLFLRIPGSRKIRKLLGIAAFLVLAGTGGKYYGVTDCLSGLLGLRGSAAVAPAPHVRPGTGRQGEAEVRSGAGAAASRQQKESPRQGAVPQIPENLTADYFLGLLRDDQGNGGAQGAARGGGSGK